MSLNHHERHQLSRIESRLDQSDPQLAAMLAVFTKRSKGKRMPAQEQMTTRRDRVRQAAAQIPEAFTFIAAAFVFLATVVGGLFTAMVLGRGARRQQPARQPAGQRTDRHAGPATSS